MSNTFDYYKNTLLELQELTTSKRHDYTGDENWYWNFEEAARFAGCKVATVFKVLQGVKIARLLQLTKGIEPNHESIHDTRLDLANYLLLQEAYEREIENNDE